MIGLPHFYGRLGSGEKDREIDWNIVEWNGILGHDSEMQGYTEEGTWANEMHCVMNHAPGAGSIAQPVDHCATDVPREY